MRSTKFNKVFETWIHEGKDKVLLYIAGGQTKIKGKRKMISFIIKTSLIISETQYQRWAWYCVPVVSAPLEL
jgi:hypothetical protein